MGKRDKRKKNKDTKGKGKEKTELKTEKNARKKAARHRDDDEEDIEKLIASFKKMDAEKVAVSEQPCKKPSPRVNGTLVVNPLKETELILFGGELFNGEETFVYKDLFRYNILTKEWIEVSSPTSPPPRCGHQAVTFKNWMYVFGGEFTSPSQNQFYHYKDFWRLNLETYSWEEIKDAKAGPSARSGHRMARWKNKIVLFGGFYDTLSEVKYFNDLYLFDLPTHKWQKVEFKYLDAVPPARSGFAIGVFENLLYIHGGYSKEKVKKYGEAQGIVHTDTWCMNLNNTTLTWEKVKKNGIPPTPRSGMAVAVHNKKIIVFGGVHDHDQSEDMLSHFYNDMYAFHMDTKRWFLLTLHKRSERKRRKRTEKKEENADEEIEGEEEEKEQEEAKDDDELPVYPSTRINAMMAVSNNTLYLYGGLFETENNKEVTYNDLHCLNLHKLDTFQCLFETDEPVWLGQESEDDEEEDDDDDKDDEDDEDDEEEDEEKEDEDGKEEEDQPSKEEKEPEEKVEAPKPAKKRRRKEDLQAKLNEFAKDGKPTPNPYEVLSEFFTRTKDYWWEAAIAQFKSEGMQETDPKAIRREGFQLSEERWKELRPLLQQFEKLEQLEMQQQVDKKAKPSKKGKKKK